MTSIGRMTVKRPKLNIRPALPEDSEGMAKLFMRAWHISLKKFVPESFLDQFEHKRQKEKYTIRSCDPQWILLIAQDSDKIIGMIGATNSTSALKNYQKEIRAMYIDPDFQRQGIGTLLFEKLFSELKKQQVKGIMLWCIKANQAACAFYEKHGGQRIENLPAPKEYSITPHITYVWDLAP